MNNINITYSPVNDHRGTGLVERTIRTLKYRLLAMKMSQRDTLNLNSALKLATRNLRWDPLQSLHSYQDNAPISPFYMQFNRHPRISNTLRPSMSLTRSPISERLYNLPKLVDANAPWDWPSEGEISDTEVPKSQPAKSGKGSRHPRNQSTNPRIPTPSPAAAHSSQSSEMVVTDDETGARYAITTSVNTPPTPENELVIPPGRQIWQAAAKASSGEYYFRPVHDTVVSSSDHTITLRSGKVLRKNTVALGPRVSKPQKKKQPQRASTPNQTPLSSDSDIDPPVTAAPVQHPPSRPQFTVAATPTKTPPAVDPSPHASSPATSDSEPDISTGPSTVIPLDQSAKPDEISISDKMRQGSRSIRPTMSEDISNSEEAAIFTNEMEEAIRRSLAESPHTQIQNMDDILQQQLPADFTENLTISPHTQAALPSISPSKLQHLKRLAMQSKRPFARTAAETAIHPRISISKSKRSKTKPKKWTAPQSTSAPTTSSKRKLTVASPPPDAKRPKQTGIPSTKKTRPPKRNPFQTTGKGRPPSSRRRFPNVPEGAVPIDTVLPQQPPSPASSTD